MQVDREVSALLAVAAAIDGDEGTVGDEGGGRWDGKWSEEFFAVERHDVGAEFVRSSGPDFPAGMFDAVFAGAIGPASGIPPVMFGDEFFLRTGGNILRFAARCQGKTFPFVPASPFVAGAYFAVAIDYFAAHRQRLIRFAVKDARSNGDGRFRHELADENDAAPPGVSGLFAHIEAKVYFFEVAVSRNGQAADDGMIEEEPDDAEVSLALKEIELRSSGHIWRKELRRGAEIEHGEVAPVRGKKCFQH
jgi:hypothetical protein